MKKEKQCKKIRISLSQKVIFIIILVMLFCTVLWTAIMFVNMTRNARDNVLVDERAYIKTVETNAKNVEEVCNLSTLVLSQNNNLLKYIKLRKDGKDLDPIEKIDFYKNELLAIENMTNTNPYLYQIRLFVNADVTEKKPCFYKLQRMENMSWADNYTDGDWQIDYIDTVFEATTNKDIRLAGIVSDIKDDDGNLLAVLEVSTEIDNLFTGFYSDDKEELTCFFSNSGEFYCQDSQRENWAEYEEIARDFIKDKKNVNNSTIKKMKYNGKEGIISVLEMNSLDGYLFHIRLTDSTIKSYYRSQIVYIVVVFVSMMIFIFIVIIAIKNIFKRFNTLTAEVAKIEKGENVKISEQGDDEISQLGIQINKMLETLEKLNKENTNRQLLVKNAEIKSLQNQINAHFMYNVLETIKMMAEIKADYVISDAITSLGNMFRYSMKWNSGLVEVKEEIKYIQDYLNLLNLRFDYEIFLSLNIPDEFMNFKIPKMSLQPLVENSVTHGIEEMAEDTYIYIKIYEKNDIINIEVSDAGVGIPEKKLIELNKRINSNEAVDEQTEHGRALYNVQQRIKMYFGQEYGLQIFSEEGTYTKILIQIPKDKENK